MITHEKISDIMRWYGLMKKTEEEFGLVQLTAPVMGFTTLLHPEYMKTIIPKFHEDIDKDQADTLIRAEFAKRTFRDDNELTINIGEYYAMLEEVSPEQKSFIENLLIPFETFEKCGYDKITKSFKDSLAQKALRSARTIQITSSILEASPGPEKGELRVAATEKSLERYLFPAEVKNLDKFNEVVTKLADLKVPLGPKAMDRLAELYGVSEEELIAQTVAKMHQKKVTEENGMLSGDILDIMKAILAENEEKAKKEAEERAQKEKEEQERLALEEAERLATEEAERKEREAAEKAEKKRLKEEAKRKKKEEEEALKAQKEAEEAARILQEEEEKLRAEEEARLRAEEKAKAEEEARRLASMQSLEEEKKKKKKVTPFMKE